VIQGLFKQMHVSRNDDVWNRLHVLCHFSSTFRKIHIAECVFITHTCTLYQY